MASKQMIKMLASLVIREVQIKATMSYHFISLRMTESKKTNNSRYWVGGILLNSEEEWISDVCDSMDESPKHFMLNERRLT